MSNMNSTENDTEDTEEYDVMEDPDFNCCHNPYEVWKELQYLERDKQK